MAQSNGPRSDKTLTDNFGAPVGDNQNSLTAGAAGPMLLTDHFLIAAESARGEIGKQQASWFPAPSLTTMVQRPRAGRLAVLHSINPNATAIDEHIGLDLRRRPRG
jgi:hypothetical protein